MILTKTKTERYNVRLMGGKELMSAIDSLSLVNELREATSVY